VSAATEPQSSGVAGSGGELRVSRWPVCIITVLAVAALLGGNAAGRAGLAAAVIVVQLVLVVAWLALFGSAPDAAVLVGFGVVASDALLLRTRTAGAGSVIGVIGLTVVAMLLYQLVRRDPRSVTTALTVTVSAVVVASGLALLLPLRELAGGGRSAVFAGLLASGAALLVARLLPGPDAVRRPIAVAVAVLVGLGCGLPAGGLAVADAIGVGGGAGLAALLADRLLSQVRLPAGRERLGVGYPDVLLAMSALVPLALASPIAYLAGRVIATTTG
jgi:hypothetical protein